MIHVREPHLKEIRAAAELAYPRECCGLVVGRRTHGDSLLITGIHASTNVTTGSPFNSFEIDPTLRFQLMRDLQATDEAIVGHYHSHPDKPAEPSARDAAEAHEPDLAWLIVGVDQGRAREIAAFVFEPDRRDFRRLSLRLVP